MLRLGANEIVYIVLRKINTFYIWVLAPLYSFVLCHTLSNLLTSLHTPYKYKPLDLFASHLKM